MLNSPLVILFIRVISFAICAAFLLYAVKLTIKKREKRKLNKLQHIENKILPIIAKCYRIIQGEFFIVVNRIENEEYIKTTIEPLKAELKICIEETIECPDIQEAIRDFNQIFSFIIIEIAKNYRQNGNRLNNKDMYTYEDYENQLLKLNNAKDKILKLI